MLKHNEKLYVYRAFLTVGLICLTPFAWATTGGGPMEGFVNELFDIITGWGGRFAIAIAMAAGIGLAIKQNSPIAIAPAILISLIIAYGPDYLLDLSGALI